MISLSMRLGLRAGRKVASSGGSVPSNPAYVAAVLADSPLAYWRLKEASPVGAGSIADTSPNANNATPNGGLTWQQPGAVADGSGYAAAFNGSSGYLTGGAALANVLMLSPAWTIELSYFSVGDGCLFAAAADATHRVRLSLSSNQIFGMSDVGGSKSSGTLMGNGAKNWHHVVLTSAGDLYINGVAKVGVSSTTLSSTNQLTIGARNDASTFFSGRIAEVACYQSVLSSDRVAAHFDAATAHTVPSGLVFEAPCTTDLIPTTFAPGSDNVGQTATGTFVTDGDGGWFECGGGTFRSATWDNPTSYDFWTTKDEGTWETQFKYSGTLGTWLLGQLTGKDRSAINDTNDAIKFFVTPTGFQLQYAPVGSGAATLNLTKSLAADTIYNVRFRWRKNGTPTLGIDCESDSITGTTALPSLTCTALHHNLYGNDTNTTPTSLKIRNLRIYGSWQS